MSKQSVGGSTQKDAKKEKKPLQAVVIADTFIRPHCFSPFTDNSPKVLLPIVQIPMIEYTLEFLATNGVEEIIIMACAHSDQIVNYINNSRWCNTEHLPSVRVISSTTSNSVGDTLRHLSSYKCIHGDFILMSADVIASINLKKVVEEHKTRILQDEDMVMTMVLSKVAPHHGVRTQNDDLTIILDRKTNQLLKYYNNCDEDTIDITEDIIQEHSDFSILSNVLDSNILICNPKILLTFDDNFDYADIRNDFIRLMLSKDESDVIANDKIYIHIVNNGYMCRVEDWKTYHAASHDIIRKWVHPITISSNLSTNTKYKEYKKNIYKDVSNVHRTSQLISDVVISHNCTVEENTILHKTVLGKNVLIGKNCRLNTCYIFDNTQIGQNCKLFGVVIGDNVIIGDNVTMYPGTVIGNNVVIGNDMTLPFAATICLKQSTDDRDTIVEAYEDFVEDNEFPLPELSMETIQRECGKLTPGIAPLYSCFVAPEELLKLQKKDIVGVSGKGMLYLTDIHPRYGFYGKALNSLLPMSNLNLRQHTSVSMLDMVEFLNHEGEDEDEEELLITEDPVLKFFREIFETISRGYYENLLPDDVVVELSSCKFAANQNLDVYAAAVLLSYFQLANLPLPTLGMLASHNNPTSPAVFKVTKQIIDTLTMVMTKWKIGLSKFCRLESDQIAHVLPGLLYATMMNPDYIALFPIVIKTMYELEIVTSDAVVNFYETRLKSYKHRKTNNIKHPMFDANYDLEIAALTKLKPVVEWLLEDDEDEEEDEDEE